MSTTDTISSTAQDATARDVQVSRVYIKATAEAIWTALTDPEWTNRYGYKGYTSTTCAQAGRSKSSRARSSEPRPRRPGFPCPDMLVDGEVIEAEAPHKLVTTWRMLMDPTTAAEPMTTITYEIAQFDGYCSLTVAHDVTGAPVTGPWSAATARPIPMVAAAGTTWILSDLKSLLETGSVLAG